MSCYRKRPEHQHGFGLLEALVALVLLSSVGLALLAWIHQNLDAAQRMRGFYAEQDARRMALEWVRAVNPMLQPEGEKAYGNLNIAWKAEALSAPIVQTGYPQGIGRHEVALYTVRIRVTRSGESTPWLEDTFTAIGYRRVAAAAAPFTSR